MKSILNFFVKHRHKISSAFGGHVIERNFPSQKKEVDISFFETHCLSFFSFFFPPLYNHWVSPPKNDFILFFGPLPYAGKHPAPKALPYWLKKFGGAKKKSSGMPPTIAILKNIFLIFFFPKYLFGFPLQNITK